MKETSIFGYAVAALIIATLVVSRPARAGGSGPAIPMTFSAIGSAPPSSSCNNGTNACNDTNCSCLNINGKGKSALLGASTFTSQTIVTHTDVNSSLLCETALGTMTTTTANSKNTLVIAFAGLDCFNRIVTIGFDGPYTVLGGTSTGKFKNAIGGGTMAVNEDSTSGGNFYGTLNGNIILSK